MFRFRLVVLVSTLAAGCASNVAPAVTPATAPLAADLVADARSLDQPSNAARVEAVQALLRKRGLPFSLQTFPNAARQRDPREQGTNVIVDLPGPPGPEIIVGAHLDAAALKAGGYSHGMVDNGAGVVVLVRAAEALRGRRLRHRVRIVFFDMEEIGLTGSRHFASLLDKASVAAMVNVDIAGYGDTILSGAAPGAESLRQSLARVCSARNYACMGFPTLPNSDDRSFQAAGIPAISLAVLPALEAHQIWLLLNGGKESGLAPGFSPSILRTIHTPEDTADKLTPQGMMLIYETVVGLVLELDAR
jgi:Zn-dependent M28 family amino/carboxypeptidase